MTVLKDGKDYNTWMSDIPNYEFNDLIATMPLELYPNENFSFGNYDASYDTLQMNNKPDVQVFIDAMESHRSWLQNYITEWFNIEQGFEDMSDLRMAMYNSSWDQPNPALLKKYIRDNNDQTLMNELIAADTQYQAEIMSNAWVEGRKERYKNEADPIFAEAIREREMGDDTKWNTYLGLIADIKAEFPKP